jgi:hypothetical protein
MLRAMLQAMLAGRFHLAIRREDRQVPIYELTVGNKKPKLKPSDTTTLANIRRNHPDAVTLAAGTIVTVGPDPGQQTFYGVTMQDLGIFLSNLAGRPIHSKTGLPGKYDITYQIEQHPPPQEDGAATPMPADFFNLQIFNIIQDQLGLKLSAAKGSAEFLVIDHLDPIRELTNIPSVPHERSRDVTVKEALNIQRLLTMPTPDLLHLLRDCYIHQRNIVDAGLVTSATLTPDTSAPGATIPGLPPRHLVRITLRAPGSDETTNLQLVAQVENRLLGLSSISRVEVTLLPALFPIL